VHESLQIIIKACLEFSIDKRPSSSELTKVIENQIMINRDLLR
jgi:hypothetical protein